MTYEKFYHTEVLHRQFFKMYIHLFLRMSQIIKIQE